MLRDFAYHVDVLMTSLVRHTLVLHFPRLGFFRLEIERVCNTPLNISLCMDQSSCRYHVTDLYID